MKTQPKCDSHLDPHRILCDSTFDDPDDPDPVELRDLRDEICRALDAYFALGGRGFIGEIGLAEHVNPPRATRTFTAESARRDLARCLRITVDPPDLFGSSKKVKTPKPSGKQSDPQKKGVDLIVERIQLGVFEPKALRTQARLTRQKVESRANAKKPHNADLIVSMCLRWGLLGHLGAVQPSEAKDFFGPLAEAEVVPCPSHEWDSLLGGFRCVKSLAPPPEKQKEFVEKLRKECMASPTRALTTLAPWFGTDYAPP
jgi:hypothetical protein